MSQQQAGVIPLDKLIVREKAGEGSRAIYLIYSKNTAEMFEFECQHPKDKKIWLESIRYSSCLLFSSNLFFTQSSIVIEVCPIFVRVLKNTNLSEINFWEKKKIIIFCTFICLFFILFFYVFISCITEKPLISVQMKRTWAITPARIPSCRKPIPKRSGKY